METNLNIKERMGMGIAKRSKRIRVVSRDK